VKKRPAAVSMAIGAIALFLAREPLKRVVTRMWAEEEDDGLITTTVTTDTDNFNAAAPTVTASVIEGVS